MTASLEGERITVQEALYFIKPGSRNDVSTLHRLEVSSPRVHDYLTLERGLSKNSVMAYMRDIKQFMEFEERGVCESPHEH